jgi:dihydroorotate dehydrogenase (fumarate)
VETYAEGRGEVKDGEGSSLNTLGYSPLSFESYISMLVDMSSSGELNIPGRETTKPFIISVTGTAQEVGKHYSHLSRTLSSHPDLSLLMEINLSCPNIPSKPPPAYDVESLKEYIYEINMEKRMAANEGLPGLHVGIKTPPYTYQAQFEGLIEALESSALGFDVNKQDESAISFITATNTLGSCLVLREDGKPALGSANGEGIGGLAGEALYPIALGNVRTIRGMLDASKRPELRKISIIGIGGVSSAAGYKRMMGVGAVAVGVGTALGREGVSVFAKITDGLLK